MSEYKVSIRYAQSLLDSAVENKNLDRVAADVELIYNSLAGSHELKNTLANPVIKPHVKLSVLEEIFKDKISGETMDFLKFLIEKKREDLLGDIASKFLSLRDELLGIVNVDVTVAADLIDEQKEEMRRKLESVLNKKIRFKFVTDPGLVGGFVAKAGDTVFDATIMHQLDRLRKQFLTGGASLN
jgi:F-type H+-transporting ATPase subunit delta